MRLPFRRSPVRGLAILATASLAVIAAIPALPALPAITAFCALALTGPPAAALAPASGGQAVASPADLDARYRDFLDEVAPLMSDRERQVFLTLTRDYQRDAFIQKFWDLRDPFPQTPQNELRDAWQERVKLARERYGNVTEDRAHMLLIFGEPGHVFQSRCSDVVLPLEIWAFDRTTQLRHRFNLVFVQDQGAARGRYRLWAPGEGLASLLTLEQRTRAGAGNELSALSACTEGSDIAGYLADAIDEPQVAARNRLLPRPGDEWLSGFSAASADVPAGALPLAAELDISFPGRSGSRTVLQGLVRVPRAAAQPQRLDDRSFYSFLVDGEVLHQDEMFEHFRYRFSFPVPAAGAAPAAARPAPAAQPAPEAAAAPATAGPAGTPPPPPPPTDDAEIPLVFQRQLRPGSYQLRLKVEDLGGQRYFQAERDLEVPLAPVPELTAADATQPGQTPSGGSGANGAGGAGAAGAAAPAAAPAARSGVAGALAEANRALRASDQSVRLLPPGEGLLTGSVRLDAVVAGSGIDHVSFLLDGRQAFAKRRPPFSVDLNLGPQPRAHVIRALAESADGSLLAEDQLVLNAGPHRFAVRLVEPQAGKHYTASLQAEAKLDVPEGETLDRVEIYRDDTLVATLFQPPWTQPVLIPRGGRVAYVRAVAYLANGSSSEDLVLVNSPNPGERVDVQMVELYTSVTDHHGRPVSGLERGNFKVLEDGTEQTLRRFELVHDLPIHAGVLLDTSGSMLDNLETAVQAALGFFHEVIQPRDRAAVITFNGEPNLAVRFTNDRELLAGGLAGLHAEGSTALYDSIIYTLYYFGGVRGKRAVVLLTDGKDEGSRFQFRDALEYAKHSGIAFYCVGLGQTANGPDIRLKLTQLATETGGRSFFIDRVAQLSAIYHDIETELRSQYLLAYQSSKQGNDGKFRTVEVRLDRPGLDARTVPGYYP
jgi:Ca-activated chloride channel family protein